MVTSIEELSGKEKASILLIAMGPERSAKVFKHLREEELETITLQIANTSSVLPEVKEAVLEEFYQICIAQQYITEGGISYAKTVLETALGEAKAFEIISKLTASLKVRPFDFIRKTDASQLINFIQNEHPQVIALILSHLTPQKSAQVLAELPPDKQADVTKRIALMDRTSPDVVKEVEKALEKKLSALMTEDYTSIGGIESVVEILNAVDRSTEKNIMETLESEDVELAEEIKRRMFVFEDIITLDARSIQTVIRMGGIDQKDWAVALKGAKDEIQAVIFANQSKRAAAMLKEDMDFMGPVRKTDVEEAQQKVVNVIRKLQDAGEIIVARGGGDEIIA
jgi:flagellar motor switch protein FliG